MVNNLYPNPGQHSSQLKNVHIDILDYAYMKQKSMIETDSSLSGEEKTQELEKIAQKMQPLMEKYDTEEE